MFKIEIEPGPDFYHKRLAKQSDHGLKYLTDLWSIIEEEVNIFALDDEAGKVIGAVGIQQSPFDENVLWLIFISVSPGYKNIGVGKALALESVRYAKERSKRLHISSYSEEGEAHIYPVFCRLKEENKGVVYHKIPGTFELV